MARKVMAEYIERDALVRQISCNMAEYVGAPDDVLKHDEQCNYAISCVESAPAADVAPVVHSYWEHKITSYGEIVGICHNCKYPVSWFWELTKFCPNCGARMDGGNENDR